VEAKNAGLGDWIDVQRDQLAFISGPPLRLDVLEFQRLLAQCETHSHPASGVCPECLPLLGAAAELYRGDFMQGFSLRDAQAFDEWQCTQVDLLRNHMVSAMERLVRGYRSQDDSSQAIHYARRWLALDRFNEEPHRQLMQLYTSTGQRTAALNQYQECLRALRHSALDPQPETVALYQQILGGPGGPSAASEITAPVFACVDIENAAAFWALHSQKMAGVITQFTATIKELARQHTGQVAKITTDNAILFFERGRPLQFALALQRHSRLAGWGEVGPLKVRVAIHAVETRQPDLASYAADIYTTQRLLSASWGGQILLSAQALSVLSLPARGQLQDFGLHMLKDLGTLHIYGLLHPALPSNRFLPLQSLSSYRHNLPTYPTPSLAGPRNWPSLKICSLRKLPPGNVDRFRRHRQTPGAARRAADRALRRWVFFVPWPSRRPPTKSLPPWLKCSVFTFTGPKTLPGKSRTTCAPSTFCWPGQLEHLVQGAEILLSCWAARQD
jgi:class 3 adenylate cyclase